MNKAWLVSRGLVRLWNFGSGSATRWSHVTRRNHVMQNGGFRSTPRHTTSTSSAADYGLDDPLPHEMDFMSLPTQKVHTHTHTLSLSHTHTQAHTHTHRLVLVLFALTVPLPRHKKCSSPKLRVNTSRIKLLQELNWETFIARSYYLGITMFAKIKIPKIPKIIYDEFPFSTTLRHSDRYKNNLTQLISKRNYF